MKKLQVKNLHLGINQRWFCQQLAIEFAPGEVWGILGPNGCGKTTILHALAGLCQPTAGEISFCGTPLTAMNRKCIARDIGILLQDNQFTFAQTVWDYCAVARYPHLGYWQKHSRADERIIHAALVQMELEMLAKRSVMELSGGEKRRLAIAALIAQTPSVYLLDEPTNHLDIRHQMQALNFFKREAEDNAATVITTLHDVNLAQQFCDRVLLMFGDGEVMQGMKNDVLTVANVSRLYKHPLTVIQEEEKRYWLG